MLRFNAQFKDIFAKVLIVGGSVVFDVLVDNEAAACQNDDGEDPTEQHFGSLDRGRGTTSTQSRVNYDGTSLSS